MDAELGKVGQILFSKSLKTIDIVLLEAFDILKNDNCELDLLIPLCVETDWELSARISEAGSMRFLGQGRWLTTILSSISNIKTPNALMGVILGIFRAANWYDEEWNTKTKFFSLLPDVICQIIEHQSDAAKCTKNILTSSYEIELSVSIKKYVRSQKHVWQKPDRLIHVARILKNVRDDFDSEKLTLETLSPLGALILDQLLYALFGHVSISGRMYAMAYLMNEHIDELARKAKEKK